MPVSAIGQTPFQFVGDGRPPIFRRSPSRGCLHGESDVIVRAGDSGSIYDGASSRRSSPEPSSVPVLGPASSCSPGSSPSMREIFSSDEQDLIARRGEAAAKVPPVSLADEEITQLARHYYRPGVAVRARRLHLVVGPPGAGKSSLLVHPIQEAEGAIVIDSDDFKPRFKEYGRGEGGGATAKASARIAHHVLSLALAHGDNVVHPLVGGKADRLEAIIEQARSQDYRVSLHLMDIPPEVATKRVFERANSQEEEGIVQQVPPGFVLHDVGKKPRDVFYRIIQKNRLDFYAHYDNNVRPGEPPRLIMQSASISS